MCTKAQPARAPGMGEITRLLGEMREGDPKAAEELASRVYPELRLLAARKMAGQSASETLQPTGLVHEVWLRLMGGNGQHFPDRAYFFAAAGEAMRRILVENARRRKRLKRGGNLERVDLEKVDPPAPLPDDELLEVDEALTRLTECQPRAAELVKLLFFVGLTHEQAATELGVSVSTIERTWAFARAWLFREIERSRSTNTWIPDPLLKGISRDPAQEQS
ncbi:MAG TPA: ECF-type sigma factor [Verrucomicrobiae bacterium]